MAGRIFYCFVGSIYPKITFPTTYKNFRDVNNFFLQNFYIWLIYSTFAAELITNTKKTTTLWQQKRDKT